MNELKNELKVELSCGRCNFTKVITINLDEDGVFTIPNKFCPNDLSELSRDVLRQFVSEPKPKVVQESKLRQFVSEPKPEESVQMSDGQTEDEKLQMMADKNAVKKPNEPTGNIKIPRPKR